MVGISLDDERDRIAVTVSDKIVYLRGKMVDLLCLLAQREGWVSADQVHELPSWRAMSRESVGKQVARQIDAFSKRGLDLLEWRNKTTSWRLRPEVHRGLQPETVAAMLRRLEAREASATDRFSKVPLGEIVAWALNTTSASVAITAGQAEDGYAALKVAYQATDNPDLLAIANILATRIGQRLEKPHGPVPASLDSNTSIFELAVEARRLAAYAIRSDSTAWEHQVVELQRLLPRLASAGALSSKAHVLNGLALLERRLGRFHDALDRVREAIPLAVFSGDLTLIQSVLFNLGNITSDVRRIDPDHAKGVDPLPLLEMDILIRRRFGLGKDSAQAELLLAYLCLEQRDSERAAHWLHEAEAIIAISDMPNDRGLFHRVRGLLALRHAPRCPAGIADLKEAARLFDHIGNAASANWVRKELASHNAPLPPAVQLIPTSQTVLMTKT